MELVNIFFGQLGEGTYVLKARLFWASWRLAHQRPHPLQTPDYGQDDGRHQLKFVLHDSPDHEVGLSYGLQTMRNLRVRANQLHRCAGFSSPLKQAVLHRPRRHQGAVDDDHTANSQEQHFFTVAKMYDTF